MSTKPNSLGVPTETESQTGRYLRRSREQVAQLARGHRPFDYDQWMRTAPPATPDELAETEAFLFARNLEREASVAAEAGVGLHGTSGTERSSNPGADLGG